MYNKKTYFISSIFNGLILLASVVCLMTGCSDSMERKNLKTMKNSIGIEFVLIPAGRFVMGGATREECTVCKASADETPRHSVTITRAFYMGRYELTQSQWLAVMKDNPSRFKGKNRPVDTVSWHAAQLFIKGLNKMEKTSRYRLPTEAEWEYAARAGSREAYFYGDEQRSLTSYGWHGVNSGGKTRAVGRLKASPWGLYDVYGNVFEWCRDWYRSDYYRASPRIDPKGPLSGSHRIRRGGSMARSARWCRSSARDYLLPEQKNENTGFRIVKSLL